MLPAIAIAVVFLLCGFYVSFIMFNFIQNESFIFVHGFLNASIATSSVSDLDTFISTVKMD